jgi:uncharacterized membrane protein YdbT with pleckstrin-like domain
MNTIIHRSPAVVVFKIIFLEILIELVYFFVMGVAQILEQQTGFSIRLLSPITQFLLLPIQIWILIFMLTKWSIETYEIRDDEIMIRHGILNRTEKSYPYRNMQSVIVRQKFFERLVGVGTVAIYVPTLGTDLVFNELSSPQKFADKVKNAIPDEGQSQFLIKK